MPPSFTVVVLHTQNAHRDAVYIYIANVQVLLSPAFVLTHLSVCKTFTLSLTNVSASNVAQLRHNLPEHVKYGVVTVRLYFEYSVIVGEVAFVPSDPTGVSGFKHNGWKSGDPHKVVAKDVQELFAATDVRRC